MLAEPIPDAPVGSSPAFVADADAYFQQHIGASLSALLAPIESSASAGKWLRGSSAYSAIMAARRADDASLPMGNWEYELKRADWDKTGRLAADALARQSKDLQLAAWLLEAQINQTGFFGIAPCLALLRGLCEQFWEGLYPEGDESDGDMESRANIFRWINDKLLPPLRLVPVTASGRERDFCWADLEQARRNEQLRAAAGKHAESEVEGLSANEINAGIAATPTASYLALQGALGQALACIDELNDCLDARFGDDAPSMAAFGGLLGQMQDMVDAELLKRGVRPAQQEARPVAETLPADDGQVAPARPASHALMPAAGPIQDRAEAYARLAEAADFLMQIEPHSPAPYLVRRATEWGRLNTAELYQELFIRLGGQLNIFELLGVQEPGQGSGQ